MNHTTKEIKEMQAGLVARLQERGWERAARIVKAFDDPVDIDYAYRKLAEGIEPEITYVQFLLDES